MGLEIALKSLSPGENGLLSKNFIKFRWVGVYPPIGECYEEGYARGDIKKTNIYR
jgi:hypothetical protein